MLKTHFEKRKNYNNQYFKQQLMLKSSNLSSVTSYFNIDPDEFKKTGAFDTVLSVDSRLFVDPFLLPHTSISELKDGRKKILNHFKNVLTLLAITNKNDRCWREANKMLYFPEARGFNFGYGTVGSSGSGMGLKFRKQLLEVGFEVVQKGIDNPVIFELLGIFEEGIGCDRISDMVCRILLPEFMRFSERIFKHFNIKMYKIPYKDKNFYLPRNPFRNYEPIILSPKDILRDLPIAYCWSDINFVCSTNQKLRDKLSSMIGEDWKNRVKKWKKRDFKDFFFNNPKLLIDLIQSYSTSEPQFYNYQSDPSGEANWLPLARKFTSEKPLTLELLKEHPSLDNLRRVVDQIISQFRHLIEYNGLNKFLFKDNGEPKREQATQLLFYAISDCYCKANNLSISRESNAGRGPVDFKIANGKINVIVELKLSSNTHLIQAYKKQVPIYQKAERSSHAIILILKVREINNSLNKLLEMKKNDQIKGNHTPEIALVDATIQPSASKA